MANFNYNDYPRIETKAIASEVKAQLVARFAIKFSVTSDHNSLTVTWTDGPVQNLVAEIVEPYCGYESYFDGINDDYRSRLIEFHGKQATTHLKYLTYDHKFSSEFLTAALAIANERGIDTSGLSIVSWGYDSITGDYDKGTKANQVARSLSVWELGLGSATSGEKLAKTVTKHENVFLEFRFRPNDWTISYLEQQGYRHYEKRGRWKAFARDKEIDITVLDGHPTITRAEIISVKFSEKPSEEIRQALKNHSFKWNKFESEWAADYNSDRWDFAQKLESDADPSTLPIPSQSNTIDSKVKASKLRELADAMQKRVNERLNPAIGRQRHTYRRDRMASSIRQEGYALEKQQELLYALADAHENGYCPDILAKISTRTQVVSLMGGATFPCWDNGGWWSSSYSTEHRDRLAKIGIFEHNFKEAHDLLMNLANSAKDQERAKQEKLKELLSQVANSNIPGYFPTPPKVVQRLLELADIKPGMSAWEPSAGSGAIADELVKLTSFVYVSELNYSLREILISKGHRLESANCFDCDRYFDRIVANPPWGKDAGQSSGQHIQFYYSKLMPGGRLVSVCDEGVFFRSWNADKEFREWLGEVGATVEKVPDKAFLDSDRPTGVACKIVTINKPAGVIPATPRPTTSASPLIALQLLNLLDALDLDFDFVPAPEAIKPSITEVLTSICESLEALTKQSRQTLTASSGNPKINFDR